jgi:hypothetical protein
MPAAGATGGGAWMATAPGGGAVTTGAPGGGAATTAAGAWSGQMKKLSPDGSIRGPCQLAHPANSAAQASKAMRTSTRVGSFGAMQQWPSVPARQSTSPTKYRK